MGVEKLDCETESEWVNWGGKVVVAAVVVVAWRWTGLFDMVGIILVWTIWNVTEWSNLCHKTDLGGYWLLQTMTRGRFGTVVIHNMPENKQTNKTTNERPQSLFRKCGVLLMMMLFPVIFHKLGGISNTSTSPLSDQSTTSTPLIIIKRERILHQTIR